MPNQKTKMMRKKYLQFKHFKNCLCHNLDLRRNSERNVRLVSGLPGALLLDFSLTVKAATLIFISGRGSAISSAREGEIRIYL